MELKEFIKETLTQIIEGVSEARSSASKTGAIISPTGISNSNGIGDYIKPDPYKDNRQVHAVSFEVGLTSEDNNQRKGGIGVILGAFSVGGVGKNEENIRAVTNVKFTVPIVYPNK